jgi:2-hydroxychromene-2-carboxylate isomerase
MRKAVEFFFDVGSPASYLAWTQLPALCEQHGADLIYRPMLLGGVYQATGNASPATVPAKGRYVQVDCERHARRYGVPLKANPHFPVVTLFLMRAVGQDRLEFVREALV